MVIDIKEENLESFGRFKKGLQVFYFKKNSDKFKEIPRYDNFDILFYKKDSLTDVDIGVEVFENCKCGIVDEKTNKIEIKYSKSNFYNSSEYNKIRSKRLKSIILNDK